MEYSLDTRRRQAQETFHVGTLCYRALGVPPKFRRFSHFFQAESILNCATEGLHPQSWADSGIDGPEKES